MSYESSVCCFEKSDAAKRRVWTLQGDFGGFLHTTPRSGEKFGVKGGPVGGTCLFAKTEGGTCPGGDLSFELRMEHW